MIGHTPGPWYVNDDCIEADGPEGPRDVTVAVVHLNASIDADARLIAAAPELLEALKSLFADWVMLVGEDLRNDEVALLWKCCEDAVAKAEGRRE